MLKKIFTLNMTAFEKKARFKKNKFTLTYENKKKFCLQKNLFVLFEIFELKTQPGICYRHLQSNFA